tara:strand:- start:7690 stop:7968 length:279 start_codon:yes stop_codon:yes gene_type:complete
MDGVINSKLRIRNNKNLILERDGVSYIPVEYDGKKYSAAWMMADVAINDDDLDRMERMEKAGWIPLSFTPGQINMRRHILAADDVWFMWKRA